MPWWALPAANYVSAPLSGSEVPSEVRSGWDEGEKWEQGRQKRRPVESSDGLVSTDSSCLHTSPMPARSRRGRVASSACVLA